MKKKIVRKKLRPEEVSSSENDSDSEPELIQKKPTKPFRLDFTQNEVEQVKEQEPEVSAIYDVDEERIMKKSVITPDYNRLHPSEYVESSLRQAKLLRKKIRGQTAGKGWNDMPATEITDERKRDIEVLLMRDALDPKSHYKKPDRQVLPKYFQVGRVIEDKADYYSSRMTKKERKRTIVEELMADHELIAKNKHRFEEIQKRKAMTRRGTFQKGFISKKSKRKNKTKSH